MDRVSETKANNHYIKKKDFETIGEIQYFERENISMIRPTLDLTPICTNTTNKIMSLIDSIPVWTKTLEPMPLIRPMEFLEQYGKAHVPDDPDSDPSLSDYSPKKNKRDKKKNNRKLKKDD